MDLFFLEGTGNLDTGKTADATTFGFATEGGQAFDGIMVGQGGMSYAGSSQSCHQRFWGKMPVAAA